MQPEITDKIQGWQIESMSGTYFVPSFVESTAVELNEQATTERLSQYVPSGEVLSYEVVKGYFGRYSASGFLDCTDWSFSPNRRKLEKELRDMYGNDD